MHTVKTVAHCQDSCGLSRKLQTVANKCTYVCSCLQRPFLKGFDIFLLLHSIARLKFARQISLYTTLYQVWFWNFLEFCVSHSVNSACVGVQRSCEGRQPDFSTTRNWYKVLNYIFFSYSKGYVQLKILVVFNCTYSLE